MEIITTERLKRFLIGLVVGLIVAGLILFADATRPQKPDDIRLNERGECVYPMSLSFALGLAEMGFIMSFVSRFTFALRDGVSGPIFMLRILLVFISWCLALSACWYLLMDVSAIRPGNRGKAPECYTYLEADHHHFKKKSWNLGLLAIIFGGCSSKLLFSPPPPVAS